MTGGNQPLAGDLGCWSAIGHPISIEYQVILLEEIRADAVNGLHLLRHGGIEVGGVLFGTKSYSHDRSELIIFMTPHVIYDESGLIEASNELRDRVKKLQKYVKEL